MLRIARSFHIFPMLILSFFRSKTNESALEQNFSKQRKKMLKYNAFSTHNAI